MVSVFSQDNNIYVYRECIIEAHLSRSLEKNLNGYSGNSFMGVRTCSRAFFTTVAYFVIPLEFADDANDFGKLY